MTSIRDVADAVGVSTATVSRALRGLPRVSTETRQRVLRAAHELHYEASPSAAALASGRTGAVAVVVPHVTRWFFAGVVHGAEGPLREAGYDVLLYALAEDAAVRRRVLLTQLLRKRADAVLVLCLTPTAEERAALARLRGPVVAVGATAEGWTSVGIDDLEVARSAVCHLVDLGHRDIGYLGGATEGPLDFRAPQMRRRGFEETLRAAGLPVRAQWCLDGAFTVEGARRATRDLLRGSASGAMPTALFAASDEMAVGAMYELRAAGVRVPEDVSVVGVDDHDMAEMFALTTVAQPVHEQGRIAARLLVDALDARAAHRHTEPATVTLPTRLVVRGTTAPPRAAVTSPRAPAYREAGTRPRSQSAP